jgi:hypothetical protein
MDDKTRKKPRGRPTFKDSEKAREAARKRWATAPASSYDPAIAKLYEGPGMNTKALEQQAREPGELEQARACPPSCDPLPGGGPIAQTAPGDLTKFSATAIEPAQESAPQEPKEPTQEDPQELRRRLIDEELARQREVARERAVGRRETSTRGPAGPVRPENMQGGYKQADHVKLDALGKVVVQPGHVPGRRDPAPPAPVAAAAAPAGAGPVITSTCVCTARVQALTLTGIEAREREHLALSAPCKLWAAERDHDGTWVRTPEAVPAERRAELAAIEPQPPPSTAPVRPRHLGRQAEWVRGTRRSPKFDDHVDGGEFPTSTIESKEAFFSEPDLDK